MVRAVRSYAGAYSDPAGAIDWNNCAVIALSHAAGIPYNIAHEIAKASGRRFRRGTNVPHMMDEAAKRGISHSGMRLARLITSYRNKPTVARFAREMPKGRFVVVTRDHALAVIDGTIYDNVWTLSKKKRVIALWEITNVQVER